MDEFEKPVKGRYLSIYPKSKYDRDIHELIGAKNFSKYAANWWLSTVVRTMELVSIHLLVEDSYE
jgi:hypothetical protein